ERFFGRMPTLDLKDGIRRMADWARTVELRPGRPGPYVEIEKGLPRSWAQRVGKRLPCGNWDIEQSANLARDRPSGIFCSLPSCSAPIWWGWVWFISMTQCACMCLVLRCPAPAWN